MKRTAEVVIIGGGCMGASVAYHLAQCGVMADLGLEALYVVYPGPKRYALAKRVEALPIAALPSVLPQRG